MADTKISNLTAASTLAGTEVLPVVQSSTTKKATIAQVAAGVATLKFPDGLTVDPTGTNGSIGFGVDGVEDGVTSFVGQTRASQTRLRISAAEADANGGQHLFIGPYGNDVNNDQYGMAIEYGGVVEAWCKDFSIHCHHQSGGASDGARFWVGNEVDTGGLFSTAYYGAGGTESYVTLAADTFEHLTHGEMRFQVRGTSNSFKFQQGAYGSETTRVKIDGFGQTIIGVDQTASPAGRLTVAPFSTASVGATFYGLTSQAADIFRVTGLSAGILFRFDKNGTPITKVNAAPADGDLSAGECSWWFDSTNGAAKAKFKGKSANGTVVSGEVALA